MLAKVNTYTNIGTLGQEVNVEVDIYSGIPAFETVGLAGTAVKESRERVRSAIKNSAFAYPVKRITVNLAPADVKKDSVGFDLSIALGVLIASEQAKPTAETKDIIFLGELSLDGSVKAIKGILPILISALQQGYKRVVVPTENSDEASFIEGLEIASVSTLREAVDIVNGLTFNAIPHKKYDSVLSSVVYDCDFSEIKGQTLAKRAMEIAVAGGHNILLKGPPGTGKSMLAKAVPTIMPPLTFEEAIEVTKIHSIAGILDNSVGIVANRPFRTPHHTATMIALIGGGANAKPGEVSLAHNGVLFLDEVPEFSRHTLETLRQPMEDGKIMITRISQTVEYAAQFMLIASMNPCPCGNYGSKKQPCTCTFAQIKSYVGKLSAPLLDRIDISVEVDNMEYGELRGERAEESSENVRERVIAARKLQEKRFSGTPVHSNSRMNNAMIKQYCALDRTSERLLEAAFSRLNMSARALNRILKVARTIADLDGAENIQTQHVSEALQYRQA